MSTSRTYGGWRKPASPGLGSLTLLPTLGLFGGLITSILATTIAGVVPGMVCAGLFVLATAPVVVPVGERPAWRYGALRWAWARARRSGTSLYRSGPLGYLPDEDCRLPGLLARSRVWPGIDAYSRPFALIQHPYTHQWTVVLAVNPNGGTLISCDERDGRVAQWDGWLAGLGREHGVDQVAVVLDQVPDPGRILRACVEDAITADAPAFAAQMMREAAEVYPTGVAEIAGTVAITFSGRKLGVPTGSEPNAVRAAEVAAREIGTRLPGLSRSLVATGSGEGQPVTVDGLAATVRAAFDPDVQVPLAEAAARGRESGLRWEDAGPVAAEEMWDRYRHDSGLSQVLEMTRPPRGTVYDTVLQPLIAPMPGVHRKRVTLLYRPLDSAEAPAALDLQMRAAVNRATRRNLTHAHDSAEVRAAVQATQEEAQGAGVTTVSLIVTVTVDGETPHAELELRSATEAVVRAARSAQVQLRPVLGAQASAFAAGLGVGIVPLNHSLVPATVRASI